VKHLNQANHEHEYRTCATFMITVDDYRNRYGPRSNWWGDFTSSETRTLYHSLLPKSLSDLESKMEMSLEDRAKVASMSRHAAKLYARERCTLPGRVVAQLYDGFRTLKTLGKWSPSGLSWEDVWLKYKNEVLSEFGDKLTPTELNERICLKILEKSCKTNELFDSANGLREFKPDPSTLLLSMLRFV